MFSPRSRGLLLLVVAASGLAVALAAAAPRGASAALPITTVQTRPAVVSPMWAGYVAGDGPYESVSGTFDVPSLDPTPFGSFVYEWVGLGTGPVIQAGVAALYDPVTRRTSYQAWWEIYPSEPVIRPIDTVRVRPGDRVAVAISHVGGSSWRIALTNVTSGASFATVQRYTGPRDTADWIVEAPSAPQGDVLPLGTFRPAVTFRDLRAVGPVVSMATYTIAKAGVTLARPGAMTPSGFSVAYVAPHRPLPPLRVTRILAGAALDLPVSGGISGESVEWQVSTDLSRWQLLSTARFDDAGTALLTVRPLTTEFFRTRFPTTGGYGPVVTGVQVVLPPTVPPSPVPSPSPSPASSATPEPAASPGPTASSSPTATPGPSSSPEPAASPSPRPLPTGSIAGIVFGPDGRPAGGIQVAAQRFPGSGFDSDVTASDGTYRLRWLPGGTYRIFVRDTTGRLPTGFLDGSRLTAFGPLASTVTVGKALSEVDIRIPAGHTIRGRVTAAGDPLASVHVSACGAENAFLPETFTPACATAITASDGTYSVAVLPGPVTIRTADTEKYSSTYYARSGPTDDGTAASILDATASDIGGIDIAPAPKPREGIVFGFVSASDGSRQSGVVASVCSTTAASDCRYATTDTMGFYLARVPAGTYSVAIIDPSAEQPSGFYGTDGFTAVPEDAAILSVVPDVAREADVRLPAGHFVTGTVRGADGLPMANVIVSPCASPSCAGPWTATRDDGSYKLCLVPGTYSLHVMDVSGAAVSGYLSGSGLGDATHAMRVTAAADVRGLDVAMSQPSTAIAVGVTTTGPFESGHVLAAPRNRYVTVRIAVGKGFAGNAVAIEVSRRGDTGGWSSFHRLTTRRVAADGFAYYSFRPSGWTAVRGALRDPVTSASAATDGLGDVVVRSGAVVARPAP